MAEIELENIEHLKELQLWKNTIGNYEIGTKYPKKENEDKPKEPTPILLNDVLGTKAQQVLFKDCPSESPKTAREKFLEYLHDKVLKNADKDVPENKRNQETINLEQLLDKEGVKLYKAAIKEENNSKEYREAVFQKSLDKCEGEKWDKRLVLWVGGPSSSGKTFNANEVVKSINDTWQKQLEEKNQTAPNQKKPGNYVVAVDGGNDREVSQIRQMVLQVALAKGHKGIQDLHTNTKLTAKNHVKAAADEEKLNIVIPDTFVAGFPSRMNNIRKYNSDENVKQAFCDISSKKVKDNPQEQAVKDEQFKDWVFHSGNSRAWNADKKWGKEGASKDHRIQMNNREIGCESKVYEPENFTFGRKFTDMAREYFNFLTKNKNDPIAKVHTKENDLVLLKKGDKGNWVPLERTDSKTATYNGEKVVQIDASKVPQFQKEQSQKAMIEKIDSNINKVFKNMSIKSPDQFQEFLKQTKALDRIEAWINKIQEGDIEKKNEQLFSDLKDKQALLKEKVDNKLKQQKSDVVLAKSRNEEKPEAAKEPFLEKQNSMVFSYNTAKTETRARSKSEPEPVKPTATSEWRSTKPSKP